MPFSTTNTEPKIDATVTVKFTGLMLLKPGEGNTCEVGVHRLSPVHTFEAMLVVHQPGLPLTFKRLTSGPLTAPMSIDVAPVPAAGVQLFAKDPFDRSNGKSHDFDYRWAINMRKLNPNADFTNDARPAVIINSGILYSSNLTPKGMNPELAATPPAPSTAPPEPGAAPKPLHRFAADLALAIDVPAGSVLTISWEEAGMPRLLDLPRTSIDRAGTTYTISLMNDPPTGTVVPHDEMDLYYDVLEEGGAPIPPAKRFRIKLPPGATDAIPCMPVVLHP